jgi:transcriptional regulator with XRE-family HTH domain
MKFYAEHAKEIRRLRSLKVSDLAMNLGITENTYYRWERNEFLPKSNDVRILAELLSVDVSYISDLQSFRKYDDIYEQIEMNELFNKEDIPVEMQKSLIKLDNFFTALKNENKILKFNNTRFMQIIHANRIASYVKDEDLVFTICNSGFLTLLGSKFKYINKTNRNIFTPEEADALTALERNILNTGQPIDNYKIKLFNNSYLFFGTKIINAAKKVNILASLIDIEYYEKIISKYNAFDFIIDRLQGAMWTIKLKPYIHYELLSHKIEKITGYPYNYFKDNPNKWRDIIYPGDLEKYISLNIFNKNETSHKNLYIYRIITADNKIKWIRERIYYDNISDRFCGVITDITKDKENE